MLLLACNRVVVVSQFLLSLGTEVCLRQGSSRPSYSRPNWSAVVVCGLLIISNFLKAFDCPVFVAILITLFCRRFGYIPLIVLPFEIVAVLVSPFWPGIVQDIKKVKYQTCLFKGTFYWRKRKCKRGTGVSLLKFSFSNWRNYAVFLYQALPSGRRHL